MYQNWSQKPVLNIYEKWYKKIKCNKPDLGKYKNIKEVNVSLITMELLYVNQSAL
jgi:hypothetical protein